MQFLDIAGLRQVWKKITSSFLPINGSVSSNTKCIISPGVNSLRFTCVEGINNGPSIIVNGFAEGSQGRIVGQTIIKPEEIRWGDTDNPNYLKMNGLQMNNGKDNEVLNTNNGRIILEPLTKEEIAEILI